MNKDRWRQIESVFEAALERPDEERAAFLAEACRDDAELRAEVESLLTEKDRGENLLSDPVFTAGLSLLAKKSRALAPGQMIGAYRIVKSLGGGGMGEVYLAEDTRLPRFVAIKVLPAFHASEGDKNNSGGAGNEFIKTQLRQEALAVSSVSHPNVAHIYEIGVDGAWPFMAIEYVEGKTLRQILRTGKIDALTAVDIALQTASALTAAHAAGVIHRDIKPENIILRDDGYVKVLDFGVAKLVGMRNAENEVSTPSSNEGNPQSAIPERHLTDAGIVTGTLSYMSPEQSRGAATDARADVWSLGVVLYEMLGGEKPFGGETPGDVRTAIFSKEPQFLQNIEAERELLNAILAKCLEKDSERRYQSARDLAKDLKRARRKIEAALLASNKSSAGVFNAAEFSVKETNGESFAQITRPDFDGEQTQESFKKLPRRRTLPFFVLLLTVLILPALPAGFFALTNYFSAASGESEKIQLLQIFTPETKPEGEISNLGFSPDGKFIVFQVYNDGESRIFVRAAQSGGGLAKITDGQTEDYAPVWSPDGTQIAFLSARSDQTVVKTVSYLGGRALSETRLSPPEDARAQLIKWSSDGKRIFFEAGGKLKAIELDSGQISEIYSAVSQSARNFRVSPDEQWVAFTTIESAREQIWTKSLAGGAATRITDQNYRNLSPSWFPDGRRIAFSSNRTGDFQIFSADVAGKNLKQLTFNNHNSHSPAVSPDGGLVFYNLAVNFDNN